MKYEITMSPPLMPKTVVPANTSGVIPVNQVIVEQIPHQLRAAFMRGNWARDKLCSDILRRELWTKCGKPRGVIIARELNQ